MKVLGIGDNVGDHYLHSDMLYPGGNALNFAAFASILGAKAHFMGVFGDDFVGRFVYDAASDMGIILERSRIAHGENGCPKVEIHNGERKFMCSNRGGVTRTSPLRLGGDDTEYISGFDWAHTSIFSYIIPCLPDIAATGVPLSMDFSSKADDGDFRACCPYLTLAIVSASHLTEGETPALMRRLRDYGAKYVIATRGEQGGYFLDEHDIYHHPPFLVAATDTLGAGDAFLTAFIIRYAPFLRGDKTGDPAAARAAALAAMEAGSRLAAKTCLTDGAFGRGIPYKDAQRKYGSD